MKPNKKILKIHPLDNLIVALSDLNKGEIFNIGNKKIKLKTDVKAKHKLRPNEPSSHGSGKPIKVPI